MKRLSTIFLLAGALLLSACNKEDILQSPSGTEALRFAGTLEKGSELLTRATPTPEVLDDKQGAITIHQLATTLPAFATAIYEVKNGYYGTLVPVGNEYLDWSTKVGSVVFHAWTTPNGVTAPIDFTISSDGTVDFMKENAALEHFIGARAEADYSTSPTVTLPFNHLVCKITIDLRDQYNKVINDATITFTDVNNEADFSTGDESGTDEKKAPHVTRKAVGGGESPLGLTYNRDASFYLPGLDFVGVDAVGDLCILYGGDTYYGTMKGLKIETKDDKGSVTGYVGLDKLLAGQHLHLKMTLTRGSGIGVGPTILPWEYKEPDNAYGNAAKGIYTEEQLIQLATSVNTDGKIPADLNSGTEDSPIVRLYKNITIASGTTWAAIGTITNPFSGTFDGNGYTISDFSRAGLFGEVKGSTIKNVSLSGTAAGAGVGTTIGLLACSTDENTTIDNCHVVGASSITNTDATAGGLIGTAGTGTTLTNCSVETTGTITGNPAGALVGNFQGTSISNCFAVFAGANGVGLIGVTGSAETTYSYYWNTSHSNASSGFWGASSSETGTIAFDADVLTVTIGGAAPTSLLDALNKGITTSFKGWVYVYDKDYPVFRIK